MPEAREHRSVHEVVASAPADVVYGMIADATQWPLFLPTFVHVEQLAFDGTTERLRMWATAGGGISSWVTRRHLDIARRRVDFHQELPARPARSMRGVWTVEPLGAQRCRVVVECLYTVAEEWSADADWLARVTRENCRAELDALAALAERWTRLGELTLSFEDTVRVKGPSELIFDFLYRAVDWPDELPHVTTMDLVEDQPGVQVMSMGSLSVDGSAHSTSSVRICFPSAGRIVYKQTRTAELLAAHTGEWSVEPDESGVNVIARHSVLLREEGIARVLGPDATAEDAGRQVRDALGRAGLMVLEHAAHHAVSAVRVL